MWRARRGRGECGVGARRRVYGRRVAGGDVVAVCRGVVRGGLRGRTGLRYGVRPCGLGRRLCDGGYGGCRFDRRRVRVGRRALLAPFGGVGGTGLVWAVTLLAAFGRIAAVGVERQARERCGQEGGRGFSVVGFASVPRYAIYTYLDFGRVAEVRLIEVLGRNVERGKLWQRRRRPQAALLNVLDLVVRDEVLRDARDCEGESLAYDKYGNTSVQDNR